MTIDDEAERIAKGFGYRGQSRVTPSAFQLNGERPKPPKVPETLLRARADADIERMWAEDDRRASGEPECPLRNLLSRPYWADHCDNAIRTQHDDATDPYPNQWVHFDVQQMQRTIDKAARHAMMYGSGPVTLHPPEPDVLTLEKLRQAMSAVDFAKVEQRLADHLKYSLRIDDWHVPTDYARLVYGDWVEPMPPKAKTKPAGKTYVQPGRKAGKAWIDRLNQSKQAKKR